MLLLVFHSPVAVTPPNLAKLTCAPRAAENHQDPPERMINATTTDVSAAGPQGIFLGF